MKPFVPIYETFPQWIGGRVAIERWMPQKFRFIIDQDSQSLRLDWGNLNLPSHLGTSFGVSAQEFFSTQSQEFLDVLKNIGFDANLYLGQPLNKRTLHQVQAELDTVELGFLIKNRCTLRDVALHLFGVTPCPRGIQ